MSSFFPCPGDTVERSMVVNPGQTENMTSKGKPEMQNSTEYCENRI